MIYYLLDTDICIYVINARPPKVLARFRQENMGSIGVSSVTAAELAYGVTKSGSARNRRALEMFLAPLETLPFDASSIWRYGELRTELERRGQPIGTLDTIDCRPCAGIKYGAGHQQYPRIFQGVRSTAGKLGGLIGAR